MRLRDRLTVSALGKELALHTRLQNWVFFRYDFMFSPAQPAYLCSALSSVEAVQGGVLEVGCAFGNTTVFLNRHMDVEGIDRPYSCIDTFAGFNPSDVGFERFRRGKAECKYDSFMINDIRWFNKTMAVNRIDRVRAFCADAASFDYSSLGKLAFVLVDVDLYRPVAACLEAVWETLSPGGLVLVDDCSPGGPFDGALQAYQEFARNHGLQEVIELEKIGVLRK